MIDKEKVMAGIRCHSSQADFGCAGCPYADEVDDCSTCLADDILKLLEEYEATREYDRMADLREKANTFFGYELPIAWVPYNELKEK